MLHSKDIKIVKEVNLQKVKFDNFQYKCLLNILNFSKTILKIDLKGGIFCFQDLNPLIKLISNSEFLEYLDFSNISSKTNDFCQLFERLTNCKYLKILKIKNINLQTEGYKSLVQFLQRCHSIKELYIDENFITKERCLIIKDGISQHPSLKKLNLSRMSMRNVHLEIIGEIFLTNNSIETLDLSFNSIGIKF